MNRINGIKSFFLKDRLLYCNNKNELFLDFSEIAENVNSFSHIFLEDFIIYHKENNTYVYTNKTQKTFNKLILFDSITQDYEAIFTDNFRFDNNYMLLDYYIQDIKTGNEEFLFSDYFTFTFIQKDSVLLYSENKREFIKFNRNDKSIMWQYSIAHFPNYLDGFHNDTPIDVKQFIGVYNNILWVLLGGNRLIALTINSGELIHNIENIKKGTGDAHLDTKNGVLKMLAGNNYSEFDFNTLKLTENTIDKNYFFRSSNFYVGDNHLYFCGIKNFSKVTVPNSFGVFDTKKCKIVWLKEQKDDWGLFYNPPQANNRYLAILDDRSNLLIFNKNEMENRF